MGPDYQEDLRLARATLTALLAARENIEKDIARQKRKIAALAELCNEGEFIDMSVDLDLGGLTVACITVLRASRKEWLNTTEIQTALKELGFPIHTYKAPNASIATTVNRLVEDGVVVADKRLGAGAIEYKWVGRVPADHPVRKLGEGARYPRHGAINTIGDWMALNEPAAGPVEGSRGTKGGTGTIDKDIVRRTSQAAEQRKKRK